MLYSNKSNRVTLDHIVLLLVFACIAYYIYLILLNRGMLGGDVQGWNAGKVLLILESVITLYLVYNLNLLRRCSVITKIVLFWIPIGILTCSHILFQFDYINYIFNILSTLLWCLIYLFFFVLSRKNPDLFRLSTICFSFIAISSFYGYFKIVLYKNLIFANKFMYAAANEVYFIVLLLPWILLVKNRVVRNSIIIFIIAATFYSMKRNAMIIIICSICCYLIIHYRASIKKTKLKHVIFSIVIICIMYSMFTYIDNQTGGYLLSRISLLAEDRGGRPEIYKAAWKLQWEYTDIAGWIFGHGNNAVIENAMVGYSAHNDWQEVLYDFGVFGLILYLLLHIYLIRTCFLLVTAKSPYAAAFSVSYVIFFFMSLFSHLIIYPNYFIYLTSFWGAVLGMTERKYQTFRRSNMRL